MEGSRSNGKIPHALEGSRRSRNVLVDYIRFQKVLVFVRVRIDTSMDQSENKYKYCGPEVSVMF